MKCLPTGPRSSLVQTQENSHMRYENRNPPEGINTSEHRPVREFLRLSLSALVVLVAVAVLLNFTGGLLGGLLPFKAEIWLTERVDRVMQEANQQSPFAAPENGDSGDPLEQYLQTMAERVAMALDLPAAVTIEMHYSEDDVFNAYATLGGHVFLFKGLLKYLPNENALAMLMAHEFSHVRQRHPAKSIGGGLTLAVGSSVLLGATAFENRFFSIAGALASTQFSRSMETEADQLALAAVNSLYGHVNGAGDLFALFVDVRGDESGDESDDSQSDLLESFFSTHPLDNQRIAAIEKQAAANGWSTEGTITPLPTEFSRWLK